MSKTILKAFLTVAVAMTVGCGQPTTPTTPTTSQKPVPPGMKSRILASEQPADAKPVAEVQKSAENGGEVTILGRIGGAVDPWVAGRAAFTIVDPKLKPCQPDEGCPTPWDYCCSTDQLPKNRALIKVVDDTGNTLEHDAKSLLDLKELQTVVVKGTAKRDDAGNLTVLATSVYVVPDVK